MAPASEGAAARLTAPEFAPGTVWLSAAGREPGEAVAFASDATTPRQRARIATLGTAATVADEVPREAATLVVVGPVVAVREALAAWQQTSPMTVATGAPRRRSPIEDDSRC